MSVRIRLPVLLAALICGAALTVASPAASTVASATAAPRPDYPATERNDLVERQFGFAVADPFRWLEDDVRVNPRVANWVARQNAATEAYLATLPARAAFARRMTLLFDFERYGTPVKAANRYFYTRNDGLQPQAMLYVRDGLTGVGRPLIDPNSWATDGATALGEWLPSPDGKRLLYTVQDGGSDWRIVRVLDVASGQHVSNDVRWAKFSGLAWASDNGGFFYSRFPEPAAGAQFQSPNENHAVYFHRLGTEQSADRLVHAAPDQPGLNHRAEVTDDGKYLLVTSSAGTDERFGLTVYPLKAGRAGKPISLISAFAHNWDYVANRGSIFTFLTNHGAPRQRLVQINAKRAAAPVEVVPESDGTLAGASAVGERIILSYLGDAKSDARMVTLDGKPAGTIILGSIGAAAGFGGKPGDPETFFAFSSFARPSTIYRLDTATGAVSMFAEPKLTFNPADYAVTQRFFTSKDGTRVPMFLVYKKGLDLTRGAPTLLYAYGGFNQPQLPGFQPERLAWVQAGGVFALANVRGGSEYGKAWHDAGRLHNKQNVFDDFNAAGEYLIAAGITPKGGLAIQGRSNGGLLVGAVVNQRPELFAAALPMVGVMDMLRFDRFTAGRYWTDDYGFPGKEADFRTLLSYSPYHNIRTGTDYPAILVTTADIDDRVVPGHSFKYTAALQAARLGSKPQLIRIDTRAGHGSGKPTAKLIAEFADMYAFVAKHTGLTVE